MTLTNHHSESEVNQLFSRVAPQYDRMNDLISLGTQVLIREGTGGFNLSICN